MKVLSDPSEVNQFGGKIVATIGNFDGVHRGHQQLLADIKQRKSPDEAILVITFNPHPEFVIHAQGHYLISAYQKKYEYLRRAGADHILEIRFDEHLRNLNPKEFFQTYVLGIEHLTHFYFGEDFSLGKDRCFNTQAAVELLESRGIKHTVLSKVKLEDQPISSTAIRRLIDACEFSKVSACLGREYYFDSEVVVGKKIGRSIGVHTANLVIDPILKYPPLGVYATKVELEGKTYPGAMNIGRNPTVSQDNLVKVEVHIIGLSHDIYGQTIRVIPLRKIRDEKKFDSLEQLGQQIQRDLLEVQRAFEHG